MYQKAKGQLESVRVLREVEKTLSKILKQMQNLARTLKEYSTDREMNGVGDILAPRLIAEIGDVRRFHKGKALIVYTGIDAPPYQSGNFVGTKRRISKSCKIAGLNKFLRIYYARVKELYQ